MKNFIYIEKKILNFTTLIIAVFLLIPSISFGLIICYDKNGLSSATQATSCSGIYSYSTDPTLNNKVPTPTVKPQPAPVISPTPPTSSGGGYNLTPTSMTGGISDPIKNVGAPAPISGLIPCDNVTIKCDFKAFAVMINKIIDWFIGISITVATITFTIAGAKILMNPESDSERGVAKEMFTKTIWGLLIILTAWLVVNTIISTLVNTDAGALRFLSN